MPTDMEDFGIDGLLLVAGRIEKGPNNYLVLFAIAKKCIPHKGAFPSSFSGKCLAWSKDCTVPVTATIIIGRSPEEGRRACNDCCIDYDVLQRSSHVHTNILS